jgi:formylglycine-generating enzyme required for sulfatase activity
LVEEEIPPHQWYAKWLERFLPTEEDQETLCRQVQKTLSMPEGMEKETAIKQILPYPLPQVPIPGRFPFFWKRWEKAGAHPQIVEMIRLGMKLDWNQS